MIASRWIVSILISALLAVTGIAAPEAFAKPRVSQQDINKMNLDELTAMVKDLEVHWNNVRALMARKAANDYAGTLPSLKALRDYEGVQENIDLLMQVLRVEIKRSETGNFSPRVIAEALASLREIAPGKPSIYNEELGSMIEEISKRLAKMPAVARQISDVIRFTINTMKKSSFPLVSLEELIRIGEDMDDAIKNKMGRMEEYLRKSIIGQPEVIDLILYMEFRARLYSAASSKPDVVYAMGLPGTGKDTIARAWTDAIHGIPKAYERHMFSLPTMKNHADLWKVLGSATGYVGSGITPPFLEFLVQHSGGKYKFETVEGERGKVQRIVLNSEYRGETLPGYYAPESAIVFANEFHNWSRQAKDDFLKQALEHGYFTINNPNGGLTEIYVPVRFFVASNEGINLLSAREANGQRIGKPLDYEELLKKWDRAHADKGILKNEIMATNGSINDSARGGGDNPGTSEELINRIAERNILLLRPLSPEDLRRIAQITLELEAARLVPPSDFFKSVELSWTPELVEFVQGYHYNAEDNARPIQGRVDSLVQEPLLKAIQAGQLTTDKQKVKLALTVKANGDGTQNLVIDVTYQDGKTQQIERLIEETKRDLIRPAMSDERIDELGHFADDTSAEVFGVDSIVGRLGDRVLSIANTLTAGDAERPANAIGVFGLTSTGKTELAKKTAKGILGSETDLLTLDFSQIQTLHDFKARILGIKDGRGNPIPSDFMKAYDRGNGLVVVAVDEISNVRDPQLLTALYDFFREPVVTTFSDGKPRPMGGVFVIVTGNAGQEIFHAVPSHVPEVVRMAAWKQISDQLSNDVNLQAQVLAKYLPAPLVARIGKNNIFFVPPHTYRSLRQLAQLKLRLALKRLGDTKGRRGWKVTFPTQEEYVRFIDTVVIDGFNLMDQGASIDSYVRGDFESKLESLLLKHKVPSGAHVVLEYASGTDNSVKGQPGHKIFNVHVDGFERPLELRLPRPHQGASTPDEATLQILTAYHEAGHSIVRQALFSDMYKPVQISIIPGVAEIAGEWVYYAGIAVNMPQRDVNQTRDWVIRQIAVLAAGETAERLVSRGSVHSIGKVNDMERASMLAREAVLHWGLSEKWGTASVPSGVDSQEFIRGLSEERRRLLESEVDKLIDAGRGLARYTLLANFSSVLVPMAVDLAEKGMVGAQELEDFYKAHPPQAGNTLTPWAKAQLDLQAKWRAFRNPGLKSAETEIYSSLPAPSKVADIEQIALEQRQKMFDSVPLPKELPVEENTAYANSKSAPGGTNSSTSCEQLLLGSQAS